MLGGCLILQVVELGELRVSVVLRGLRVRFRLSGLLFEVSDTIRDRALARGLGALGRGHVQGRGHGLVLRAQCHVGRCGALRDGLGAARGQGHRDRIDVAIAVLAAHQVGDRALRIVGLRGRVVQRIVDAGLLALRGTQLTQDRRVFARLLVVVGHCVVVGGLSFRDLSIEVLQVDVDLRQRCVDTLELRLQGVDRRLRLRGRVRSCVTVVIRARGQRLTHRDE